MSSISKEYLVLFNATTDAIIALDNLKKKLQFAQQCAEEIYIEESEVPDDNKNPTSLELSVL